jgi:hypothetical protein
VWLDPAEQIAALLDAAGRLQSEASRVSDLASLVAALENP